MNDVIYPPLTRHHLFFLDTLKPNTTPSSPPWHLCHFPLLSIEIPSLPFSSSFTHYHLQAHFRNFKIILSPKVTLWKTHVPATCSIQSFALLLFFNFSTVFLPHCQCSMYDVVFIYVVGSYRLILVILLEKMLTSLKRVKEWKVSLLKVTKMAEQPMPKSPPGYIDLYAKRRHQAKLQVLEREIDFLQVNYLILCAFFSSNWSLFLNVYIAWYRLRHILYIYMHG